MNRRDKIAHAIFMAERYEGMMELSDPHSVEHRHLTKGMYFWKRKLYQMTTESERGHNA